MKMRLLRMAGNFVRKVITARISQQTKSKNHITGEKNCNREDKPQKPVVDSLSF